MGFEVGPQERRWCFEDWNDANLTEKGINQVKRTGKVVFGEKDCAYMGRQLLCSPFEKISGKHLDSE